MMQAQSTEVSGGNSSSNWARDYSCDVLANNVTAFCLCPKNLSGVKLKSSGIISLTKEISRQPRINFVVWLLMITVMPIVRSHCGAWLACSALHLGAGLPLSQRLTNKPDILGPLPPFAILILCPFPTPCPLSFPPGMFP